ncbi:MAG: phosphoribosyltransferase [Chroococcidiopsidaceae cyanobacterium CP_BM_ER_R8_30]|nr:phosphoribosyltransferase [Chroococcidiopsidaceae cyanobacterium CP_BM_ER_R8_30]
MLFRDRAAAGQLLATELTTYNNRSDLVVLALPRGGVPVGFEVAKALKAPLDILLVRKLGVPGQEELAMGAIASGGVRILNEEVVFSQGISEATINRVAEKEQRELERRERLYRDNRPALNLYGRTAILVDDGLATGSTMRAAVVAVKQQKPARIVIAVPLSSAKVCDEFKSEVDEIVCATMPEPFHAVGLWYECFLQTTDTEVCSLLKQSLHLQSAALQ